MRMQMRKTGMWPHLKIKVRFTACLLLMWLHKAVRQSILQVKNVLFVWISFVECVWCGSLYSDINGMDPDVVVSTRPFRNLGLSKAAQTHRLRKLRTPAKCRECDSYVYFQGAECEEVSPPSCLQTSSLQREGDADPERSSRIPMCSSWTLMIRPSSMRSTPSSLSSQCFLACHKRCLETLAIQCGHKKLQGRLQLFGREFSQVASCASDCIPFIITKCISEIERRALKMKVRECSYTVCYSESGSLPSGTQRHLKRSASCSQGIYRVNGVKTRVEKLCQAFENGKELVELSQCSPHDISNVLKLYLRQVHKQASTCTSTTPSDQWYPEIMAAIIVAEMHLIKVFLYCTIIKHCQKPITLTYIYWYVNVCLYYYM